MTNASGGKVLRFTKPPWRPVVLAERVKVRKRLSRAGGIWRLTLSCEHVVLILKIVESIAGASPPERAACWRCLAYGVPAMETPMMDAPWREIISVEEKDRSGNGSQRWRLSCGHAVVVREIATNIKEPTRPSRLQCWECATTAERPES